MGTGFIVGETGGRQDRKLPKTGKRKEETELLTETKTERQLHRQRKTSRITKSQGGIARGGGGGGGQLRGKVL